MWSVNTWPKPGDSSRRARTSSGPRCADACRSKLIVEFGLAFIADPPSHGPGPGGAVARPDAVPVPADGPHLTILTTYQRPASRQAGTGESSRSTSPTGLPGAASSRILARL